MYMFRQKDIPHYIPGINLGTIKMRITRGHIKVSNQNPGTGQFRYYTWDELAAIAHTHYLSFTGGSAANIALVVDAIRNRTTSERWLVPPKNRYDEITHWIPEDEPDESGQEIILYEVYPDRNPTSLRKYEFIPKYQFNWKGVEAVNMCSAACYYNHSYMMQRLAESVLSHHKEELHILKAEE